jgi:hypothetical protein
MDAILDLCASEGAHSPRDGVLRLPLSPIKGRPFTSLAIIPLLDYLQHAFGHPAERQQWWKSGEVYTPLCAVCI